MQKEKLVCKHGSIKAGVDFKCHDCEKNKVDEMVEMVLPKQEYMPFEWIRGWNEARKDLKKAISSGLLCLPMTADEIFKAIDDEYKYTEEQFGDTPSRLEIAKRIHRYQTKKITEE